MPILDEARFKKVCTDLREELRHDVGVQSIVCRSSLDAYIDAVMGGSTPDPDLTIWYFAWRRWSNARAEPIWRSSQRDIDQARGELVNAILSLGKGS